MEVAEKLAKCLNELDACECKVRRQTERIIQLKKDRDKFKGMIRVTLIDYGLQPADAADIFNNEKRFRKGMELIKYDMKREFHKEIMLILKKVK